MKKLISLFLFLTLTLQSGCRTCSENSSPEKEDQTYQIQFGDTLAKIARMHDLSVKELIEMNPDLDPKLIQIGDPIRVSE